VRPLPPRVLQAGQVGEVVALDEHVARADRLPEVDDGVVPVVVVVASRVSRPHRTARSRAISPTSSGMRSKRDLGGGEDARRA